MTGVDTADYPALIPGLPEGSFHIYDYQFFFRALEENVAVRVNRFTGKGALDIEKPESIGPGNHELESAA